MKKILLSAAFMLLVIPAMLTSNEISAQTVSVKIGSEDNKEKKEETKEKVVEKETVNYQLVKYGEGTDNVLLLNINSGAMWAIDTKGLTFSYKNTRLKFIPAVDTSW